MIHELWYTYLVVKIRECMQFVLSHIPWIQFWVIGQSALFSSDQYSVLGACRHALTREFLSIWKLSTTDGRRAKAWWGRGAVLCWDWERSELTMCHRPWHESITTIDVKTVFTFFNVFYFVNVFILNKVHWKFHQDVEKHLWNHRNDLTGLGYIMKVVGCRLRLLWRHAVGIISRLLEVVNYNKPKKFCPSLVPAILYLYSIRHRKRQEVEQNRANVFYSTFLNVFILSTFFTFFNVFLFF